MRKNQRVNPKKHLGQHFLTDKGIAADIVGLLSGHSGYQKILEIGPGMGVLTDFLLQQPEQELHLVEIDGESVQYLKKKYPQLKSYIHHEDFLKTDLLALMGQPFGLIGNFPYNISSQILFRLLEYRDLVPEVVGMFQMEVARRVASAPGGREYGLLSVLMQAYYQIEYAFTVPEQVFDPPPKVKSGVLHLRRNQVNKLACDEKLFIKVVKQAFSQRRKTLRNALKGLGLAEGFYQHPLMEKRAEQLGVAEFTELTLRVSLFS
jgi:16S rRNA (adenine1518-N6/adenine1519-N6)-dimethyltransferase